MIAFLLRHNLTGVAVNDLISLLKVIYPDSSLGSFIYQELFQVIGLTLMSYLPQSFSPKQRPFQMPSFPGFRYRGGHSAQTHKPIVRHGISSF